MLLPLPPSHPGHDPPRHDPPPALLGHTPIQVADHSNEIWQYVHCRRPSAAPYLRRSLAPAGQGAQWEVPRRLPTVTQLSVLLLRQRGHLRRLVLEENAGDWDDAPAAMQALLAAATADGSGLTDLTLALSQLPPEQATAVRGHALEAGLVGSQVACVTMV